MSVHCNLCGKRVSSLASLSGHYRRKHSGRVTARPALRTGQMAASVAGHRQASGIATSTATKSLSDSAYVSRLAEMENTENLSAARGPTEPDTEKPVSTSGWWWPWALLGAVFLFLALSPDSGSSQRADSHLVSSYQPEGDGQ